MSPFSIADKIGMANIIAATLQGQTDALAEAISSRFGFAAGDLLSADPDFRQYLGLFRCGECRCWRPVSEMDDDDVCYECDDAASDHWGDYQ